MQGKNDVRRREVEFRVRGETSEYFSKLLIPGIIVSLLALLLAYAVSVSSLDFVIPRFVASSFFIMGMAIGAIIELIILRLYTRWRFFNHVISRSLKVSEKTLPAIHRFSELTADRIGILPPGVFVVQDPQINAYAMGVLRRIIVLNTGLIEVAGEDELKFILGHEMSHIKYGWSVPVRVAGIRLKVPLLFSSRRREYTCDRGGLIACGNINASILVLVKLATGKSLAEKIDVERIYRTEEDVQQDRVSKLSEFIASHPPIKNRIVELRRFHDSEEYRQIVGKKKG